MTTTMHSNSRVDSDIFLGLKGGVKAIVQCLFQHINCLESRERQHCLKTRMTDVFHAATKTHRSQETHPFFYHIVPPIFQLDDVAVAWVRHAEQTGAEKETELSFGKQGFEKTGLGKFYRFFFLRLRHCVDILRLAGRGASSSSTTLK